MYCNTLSPHELQRIDSLHCYRNVNEDIFEIDAEARRGTPGGEHQRLKDNYRETMVPVVALEYVSN